MILICFTYDGQTQDLNSLLQVYITSDRTRIRSSIGSKNLQHVFVMKQNKHISNLNPNSEDILRNQIPSAYLLSYLSINADSPL